jgi:DNA-directed RNA polymerase subunit K/omega
MSDIKSKAQGLDPNIKARDIRGMVTDTQNIYETLSIISKRAKQISVDMKLELHQKLDEFAVSSDTIEEVHENKEQIEISKYYERLPNPAIIAMDEYLRNQIDFRYINENDMK